LYAGADDNASGAAVVLELARLISECANPARTIVFALWNGEEDGLRGSVYYFFHSIYPIDSTVAAYSVDMVGAGEDTNLVLYGAVDDANAWLGQVMAGSAADMGFEWDVTPGEVMYASDHAPFAMWGIPAVCAMSGALETHPYYHTPADTVANSGASYVGMSASMMYAGLKPLVEGTEEVYLTSGKAMLRDATPARIDSRDPFHRDR
jgi:Zn-dependent M28 family amino/carboxypeptidase